MVFLFVCVNGVEEEECFGDVLDTVLPLSVFVYQMEDDISRSIPAESRRKRFPLQYGGEDASDADTEWLLYEDVVVAAEREGVHVARLEHSAAPSLHQPAPVASEGGARLARQELCERVLRTEGAQAQAQGDHVALLVVVRVTGVAQQVELGQVLALHGVQLRVQLVQEGRLVEGVERPIEWIDGDHRVVGQDSRLALQQSLPPRSSHRSSELGHDDSSSC